MSNQTVLSESEKQRADPVVAADKLLSTISSTSALCRGLFITTLTVWLFLVATLVNISDRDLFLKSSLPLPLINLDIPFISFFIFAPLVYAILQTQFLLQLWMLFNKLEAFHRQVRRIRSAEVQQSFRDQLPVFYFVQLWSKQTDLTNWIIKAMLHFSRFFIIYLAPLSLLFLFQARFLAFQSFGITLWHQTLSFVLLFLTAAFHFTIINPEGLRDLKPYFSGEKTWNQKTTSLLQTGLLGVSRTFKGYPLDVFVALLCFQVLALQLSLFALGTVDLHSFFAASICLLLFGIILMLWFTFRAWAFSLFVVVSITTMATTPIGSPDDRRFGDIFPPTALFFGGINEEGTYKILFSWWPWQKRLRLREQRFDKSAMDTATFNALIQRQGLHQARETKKYWGKQRQPFFYNRNFRFANMHKANLAGAIMEYSDFSGAYLRKANFSETDLEKSKFVKANMEKIQLPFSSLITADLSHSCLRKANLTGADLEGANFADAFARGAIFDAADATKVGFNKTELQNAWFHAANFIDTEFEGTKLTKNHFEGAYFGFTFPPEKGPARTFNYSLFPGLKSGKPLNIFRAGKLIKGKIYPPFIPIPGAEEQPDWQRLKESLTTIFDREIESEHKKFVTRVMSAYPVEELSTRKLSNLLMLVFGANVSEAKPSSQISKSDNISAPDC